MSLKLNLGCGSDYREGYVNVDHPRSVPKKDVAHNLEVLPWPFADGSADEILMNGALEHLTFPDDKINEVHRILKVGGVFHGFVPYAHADGAFQALDHRWFFTEKSFDTICGISGYDALGSKQLFRPEYIRLVACSNTPKTRMRSMIPVPVRMFLRHWLWNMFDDVEFRMVKV